MTDTPMIQTIADALAAKEYTELTDVQVEVSKPELVEKDLLVSAQTGSGKTVGFGLAIAPTILGDSTHFGRAATPLALVIAPTRELAMQVKRELTWLYGKAGAIVASTVGGMDTRDERRALDRGAHVVVATPGRLVDHINRGAIDLSDVRAVVLDEADEMLDMGFKEDLEFILDATPSDRRTLLFSATVPRGIAHLAKSYQKDDAVRVVTASEKKQHSDIEYRALSVAADSENAIINVLRYYEAPNAIVFANTRATVNRLTSRFSNRGFSVVALSGELSQNERTHALQAMRDGRARVCIATDVAARGIDLPNLELVIHAELPNNAETMLHRSGRTGRAGRKGVSALIVTKRDRKKAERILQFAKVDAEWARPPSADEVMRRDEERLLADPVWDQPVTEAETDFVTQLIEKYSAETIAAAYVRLYRTGQSAPEELAPADAKAPPKREAFGPSTWFEVSIGRDNNAEPRWLLPSLCRAGGIDKDAIGAIRVQDKVSYVEIKNTAVDGFMANMGPDLKLEDEAVLKKLDEVPAAAKAPRNAGGKPRREDRGGDRRGPKRDFDGKGKGAPRGDRKPRHDKPRGDKKWDDKPKRDRKPREDFGDIGNTRGKSGGKQSTERSHSPKSDYNPDHKAGKPAGKSKAKRLFDKVEAEAKPRGKSDWGDKPRGKSNWDDKPRGKGGKPSGGGSGTKHAGKFSKSGGGKPKSDKPRGNAADASKRFTPPGKNPLTRPGGKPRVNRGAGAKPKR